MKSHACVFSVLFLAASVAAHSENCPRSTDACPTTTIPGCNTCCCNSSSSAEFFESADGAAALECTAMPALYEVKLVSTWSQTCHPDSYTDEAQWTTPYAIAHNTSFQLWGACENEFCQQFYQFSTGTSQPLNDFLVQSLIGNFLVDLVRLGPVTSGDGCTTGEVVVDRYHPLVSVIARQVPRADSVAGVADLILCDGGTWKESVRMCLDLFSTGAASQRAPRDTHDSNCSYGYIQWTLLETEEFEPRDEIPEACYPRVPEKCPETGPIQDCPSCCCESSQNVEFYNPDAPTEPSCTAPVPASYNITFTFNWTQTCHPDYSFGFQAFMNPVALSHNSQFRMWDACMDNPTLGVRSIAENGRTNVTLQEGEAAGEHTLDGSFGDILFGGVGSVSITLSVDKEHQWVSAGLMLVPSADRFLGVADLRLCNGETWKERVKVCLELFASATASERVAPEGERNSIQANNCSFGYAEFNLMGSSTVTDSTAATVQAMNVGILLAAMFTPFLHLLN